MPKRTIGLIVSLILVTGALLYIAASTQKETQVSKISPTPVTGPEVKKTTVLSLTPNPLYLSSPSGSLGVYLEDMERNISAVQLELAYDPKVVTSINLSPGTFFEKPTVLINRINKEAGTVTYALGIMPGQQSVKGKGPIANIDFTVNNTAPQTTINILPQSLVTSLGVSRSVLKEGTGTTIFIKK